MLNRPSKAAIRPFGLIIALMAALAVGLWLLLPGGLLQAQDATLDYAENGTDAVATFTATDPERAMIYWSLLDMIPSAPPEIDGTPLRDADIADAADFMISANGVLSFVIPPDHEDADDADEDNVYNIVVVASDDARGAGTADDAVNMAYKKVTVTVTEVDEPGMVTLSSLQPQVGAELTATLTDPEADSPADLTWKWEKSMDMASWSTIDNGTAGTYMPLAAHVGRYLRIVATYDDSNGDERTAQAVSANTVRTEPTTADPEPVFPDDSDARTVDENSAAGGNVGKPVAATDTSDDVVTYSLGGTDEDKFEIDPATGQITVGTRAIMNHETNPTYMVTVTATDASGDAPAAETVTITVKDLNEAPMVTEGVTMVEHAEDDADVDTDDATALTVTGATYTTSDPEGGTVTLMAKGTDGDKFRISEAGALTFKDAPNYEMPVDSNRDNAYMVTVVATDDGVEADGKNKMTAMREVTIMVTNVEEDGMVTLSAQQPKIGVGLTASVTDDPDGGVTNVTWVWERDDDPDDADLNTGMEEVIEGATSASYTPTKDDDGKYLRAIATYTDGEGQDMAMATSANMVQKRTDNPPMFPKMETGKRSIQEGMSGAVGDPVNAMDEDMGQVLTYSLSGANAGSFTIMQDDPLTTGTDENEGGQISVKSEVKLDYETKSTYMVTVTATDPDNLKAMIDVTINVTDMNEAPKVTGDAEKDYAENGTRAVATYRATDPERAMIYWSLLDMIPSAPPEIDGTPLRDADIADAADFMISANGVLSFVIPPDHEDADDADEDNVYNIVVVASDDARGAGTADDAVNMAYKKVTVTVTEVDEPGMVTLSSLQPQVGAELTATLTDPEADSPADLTWKWYHSSSRSGGSEIDGQTDNSYMPLAAHVGRYLRIVATYDDSNGDERTAQAVSANRVEVEPEVSTNDPEPVFPDDSDARTVDENSAAGGNVGKPVAATDTSDDVVTYSLGGTDEDKFEIDPATGQITVGTRAIMNHETNPTYMVTVTATDASGDAPAAETVTITVKDLNEAPMVTEGVTMVEHAEDDADVDTDDATALTVTGATYTTSDPEGGTVTLMAKGTDGDKFRISEAGALTFKDAPNYEMPVDSNRDNAYMVTVVATDDGVEADGKNKMTAMREVTIMVTNVEEDGMVTLSAQQPKIGVGLTASVTDDPDGGVTNVTWVWERDDDPDDADLNTGMEEVIEGATSASYTPTKDDDGKYLRAIATYTDGEGQDMAMATSANMVQKRTDNPPMFPKMETGKRSIQEGMSGAVGDPVNAMDEDMGQVLTYSLSGANAGSFTIMQDDPLTTGTDENEGGQISVKSEVKLDYETKSTYMVTVTATDPDNLKAMIDVTINVTDMNEAPEIRRVTLQPRAPMFRSTATERSIQENTVAGSDIGAPVMATDANGETLTYTLSGTDAASFDIEATTGQLKTKAPLNYEAKDSYRVTVTARDPGRLSDTITVTIAVTDEQEAGTGDALLDEYDPNGDDTIERADMRRAVADFFGTSPTLTRADMRRLVALYFA